MTGHGGTTAEANSGRWASEHRLDALIAWATRLSRRRAWVITGLAVALAISVSRLVGPHVWFGPVFLLIICLPAWALGWREGIFVGLCCAGLSIAVNGLASYPVGEVAIVWNLFMRILSVGIIVALVGGFRRSYDREWRRARSDDLTGVLTKQAFQEEVAAARCRREWAILVYVDLDGFKQINDCFGHAAGDEVLRAFAGGVRAHIRPDDIFARIGGDEFLLFLPVLDEDDGYRMAEQIHARMNAILTRIPHPLRCSTGVLLVDPDANTMTDADIAIADHLMYEAKQHGAALRVSNRSAEPQEERRSQRTRRHDSSRHAA